MKRMLLVTLATSTLTALVVGNAYSQKRQFYTTLVYLLNSNRTLGILYVQAAVMVWVTTTAFKGLFFGTLRAAEVEHLVEKSWYMILETFILLAGFHEDMQVGFVATITFLFVVKAFHWLIEERINYMERSPLITLTFHFRAVAILFLLASVDLLYMRYSWASLRTKGASVQIVFGLEYTIMLFMAINTFLHYVLHSIDLRSEDPWENKTIFMRYVDIGVGFMKLCLYMSYMLFMMWILFIPLHIARRIFITAKHFQKSVNDVLSSHQAIRNLNTLYPDATEEELRAASTVCIICREDMLQRCKKLPCKHIFHTSCLRSWFQRQQNCPTCRMDVLSHSASLRRHRRQGQEQGAHQGPARGGLPPGLPPGPPGLFNPMMPPPHPHMWAPPPLPPGMVPPPQPNPPAEGAENQPPQQPPGATPGEGAGDGAAQGGASGGRSGAEGTTSQQAHPHTSPSPPFPPGFPGFTPFTMPHFMMQPPFGGGGMPGSLGGLTEDQLRSLEGMERANVEARITVLRNIQRLLDAAVAQMVQYSTVMASMGVAAGPGFPGYPFPPGTAAATDSQPPPPTSSSSQDSPPPPANNPAPSSIPSSSPPKPLVEGEREYSFTAGQLDPQRSREREEDDDEGEGEGEGIGLFTVGGTNSISASIAPGGGEGERGESGSSGEGSPTAMDELRQRRLQRFHSVPAVSQVAATVGYSVSSASKTESGSNDPPAQSSENEQ